MSQNDIKWSYGVTAVPERGDTLLIQTLDSLAAAGFDDPTVFVDGMSLSWSPPPNMCKVVMRHPKGGAFVNWCCALLHLYTTCPDSQFYALFEDDLIACEHLREYLEQTITNDVLPEKMYWNLATHDQNLALCGPALGWYPSNQKGRGAVGLVFRNQGVKDLLTSNFLKELPIKPNTDGAIIEALRPLGYMEYIHNPSLVQHEGLISSMDGHKYPRFKAWPYDGWDPLNHEGLTV